MSNRSAALDLSTRRIKIYASAYDATARDAIADHLADTANPHGVDKSDVGLGNVVNLAPGDLPISDATAAALAAKAPLLSPALYGLPTAPTAAPGTVSTQVATAAFVQTAITALAIPTVTGDLAAHVANTNNPHSVDKNDIGLDLVANLAPADLPVSTATQAAINAVAAATAAAQADIDGHQALTSNPHAVTKAQVGLSAVANLAPADLPVSTATQTAINSAAAIGNAAQADIDGHQLNVGNPHAVTKAQLGLGSVDNTADLAKPVSTATQTAINAVAATVTTVDNRVTAHNSNVSNPHTVTKAQVGLGSVDNTADLAKPVSTATQTAINAATAIGTAAQADIDGHQALTSNPHAVTKSQIGLGNVSNLAPADLPVSTATQSALNLKAPLDSPALTGLPTGPTAPPLTSTTQLATTAYAAAAVGLVQADADEAAAAAAAAQAAADAAQADATQALADAAAALDAATTPGGAISLYGETKTGEAAAAVPIDPAWAATSPAGTVIRVVAAVADDPQTVAPITAIPLVPGRIYDVLYRVQRIVDPLDPLNDSVTCGVQWLTNTKAANGSATVDDIPLVIADGIVERTARIGIAPPATVPLDHTAPVGTVYFRPFIDLYGGDAHTTDVITLEVQDVTAAAGCCGGPVDVITPVSGETVTLADLRPRYVNNAAELAALTIRLPSSVVSGNAVEISFRSPITVLTMQTAAGAAIPSMPTNAYGPGAALLFKYVDDAVGWAYWK